MAQVNLKNIVLGGLADSQYLGVEGSVAQMVGFDIHSEPGVIKVNQKLTKESGATIDEPVSKILQSTDGNTYLFGKTNGKIWKRTSGGTYSLEATASPASGGAGILDAREYQGYIYYAMESRLGRVSVGSPTNWSGRDDDWATFGVTDDTYHPMFEVNLVLYIGDGNQIAQVDAGTFSANALDIKSPLRVSALSNWDTDLLIGTTVDSNIFRSEILRWNTWSTSFSISDPIPEIGINCFLDTDNQRIVSAGKKGRLYLYNGSQLQPHKRIPGIFPIGTSDQVTVPLNAKLNYSGLPLFGVSQGSGNSAKYGIYSLGRYSTNYSIVLNVEFLSSTGNETNMIYHAMEPVGDIFLVAWEDTDANSFGVDKLDLSNKFDGAYFVTRVITDENRTMPVNFNEGHVAYRSLPSGTGITISKQLNHSGSFTSMSSFTDTDRNLETTDDAISDANTVEFKVETSVNSNDAPDIESFHAEIYD